MPIKGFFQQLERQHSMETTIETLRRTQSALSKVSGNSDVLFYLERDIQLLLGYRVYK